MLKHIVLFELVPNTSQETLLEIKTKLEALTEQIEGLSMLRVYINNVGEGNFTLALDSELTDAQALDHYQTHPAHLECVDLLKPLIINRACVDTIG